MSEDIGKMPFNKVGTSPAPEARTAAEAEGVNEEEWRARNLPAKKLVFRWRYDNKAIPLYERRLRSLGSFNVGPAVQAWVRSRLEWVRDNRFYDMPDGVIVLSIDPEGTVDIQQEPLACAPALSRGELVSGKAPGTLWFAKDGVLYVDEAPRHAADALVRDLAETLRWEIAIGQDAPADAEPFAVSDEHGVVSCDDCADDMVAKLAECFDKLWIMRK